MTHAQDGPVAVVGAAGFLGRSLASSLARSAVPLQLFTRAAPAVSDGVAHPALCRARTIYWLATRINPQIAEQQPARVDEDRIAFQAFLLALARCGGQGRVVLVSSGGTVYDPSAPPPYAEGAPTRPLSAYGVAKLALEQLLVAHAPAEHVAMRVSNAYGPGQPVASGQGVVAHWLRAARRGEPITIFGDPATTRDYVYIDDVVRALLAVQHVQDPLPRVINVGSGIPTTLAELADTILETVADPRLRIEVMPARSFDVSRTWLDISAARRALRWLPQTPLSAGIARSWAAVQRLGDPRAD